MSQTSMRILRPRAPDEHVPTISAVARATVGTTPPSISVVIATRSRPELLRRALNAVLTQQYGGSVDCIVVFDQCPPDESLASERVRVVVNTRTPGLAGARNTGIRAATGDLVAFCDDDDEWLPGKLELQVAALLADPHAIMATTGIVVHSGSHLRQRTISATRLEFADLLGSRMTEAHPSTFLLRREKFGTLGLVDEKLPGSYAEDYDLLLRMARAGGIVSVPLPLVTVRWHPASYFADRWRTIADALEYLLDKHPEFSSCPRGMARVCGQIACAHAALGERRAALAAMRRALRHNPRERRAYLAAVLLTRVVSPGAVQRVLNARGRGI